MHGLQRLPVQNPLRLNGRDCRSCHTGNRPTKNVWTERIDQVLTHPVGGVLVFFSVMLGFFFLIFQIARIPMDMVDMLFTGLGGTIARHLPEGDLRDLLVQGVIGGMGGILVFLPQICILFFCLSLLEDVGLSLARPS